MNEVTVTPSVPALSDEWIAQRTQHLVDEVSTPSPRRSRRHLLTGVGGGAVTVAAVLVGLLGPWATPAFAGWSAHPTARSSGQLSAAEATCASLATNLANSPDFTGSASLPPESLSDVRGPYSLIVYGTDKPWLCVTGNGLSSLSEHGGAIGTTQVGGGETLGQSRSESITMGSSNDTVPAPGAAVVNLLYGAKDDTNSFTVAEGSVGSLVSGATLILSDGTSVVATVSNGLFAAWWPGQATVSSIQVSTAPSVS